MTNELIQEVEESFKQDRAEELWREYGPYVIAGAILAVLLTALIVGYRSWNDKVNASNTAVIVQAIDSQNPIETLAAVGTEIRPGHRAVSHLIAAGMLLDDGNLDGGLEQYKKIANDSDVEPVFRDLAKLMAVKVEWAKAESAEEGNAADPSGLIKQLQPLVASPQNPWHWHARVQSAMITAHGLEDYEAARKMLGPVIAANDLPPSLVEKARALHHIYTIKLSRQIDQKADEKSNATQAESTKEEAEG